MTSLAADVVAPEANKDLVFFGSSVGDPKKVYGLTSPWQNYYAPIEIAAQGRYEAELGDLVVYGEIPKEINGTFYQLHIDPLMPPAAANPFIDGDGNLAAYRFQDGKVDMKIRYVETERYLLERKAGRRLFGIYRNPWSHHPCVRLANDSPANTNVVYWAGKLLALSERSLPYSMDPDTLDTIGLETFGGQTRSKTFTAHPKVDPYREELVTWGYEAKGLASESICYYSVNKSGKIQDEHWVDMKTPGMVYPPGMAHDAWITENWIIISSMPFRVTTDEEMKAGSQHWEFVPNRPTVFLVAPRFSKTPRPAGWKEGEVRQYTTTNAVVFHTGSAWEEENGILKFEGHNVTWNYFYFFNPADYGAPPLIPEGDWVRWTVDLNQPTASQVAQVDVLFPWLSDFPRTDERFLTRKQHITHLLAAGGGREKVPGALVFDTLVRLNTQTKEYTTFWAGKGGIIAEPVFLERSPNAPEGDGWIIAWVKRDNDQRGELMIFDTKDISEPVALVKMPFGMRFQVHGNWVNNPHPSEPLPSLVKPVKAVELSGTSSLNRID